MSTNAGTEDTEEDDVEFVSVSVKKRSGFLILMRSSSRSHKLFYSYATICTSIDLHRTFILYICIYSGSFKCIHIPNEQALWSRCRGIKSLRGQEDETSRLERKLIFRSDDTGRTIDVKICTIMLRLTEAAAAPAFTWASLHHGLSLFSFRPKQRTALILLRVMDLLDVLSTQPPRVTHGSDAQLM